MNNRYLALVLTILAAVPAWAQQVPDTLAGRQFAAWLAAFNSGDKQTLRKFVAENEPSRLAHLDDVMGFREQTGGFEFMKAEESAPYRLTGIVKERNSDQYGRFTINLETAEPHYITGIGFQAISTPAEFKGAHAVTMPRLSESAAIAALRAELEKRVAEDRFAGTVLVAKNDKAIFSGAYGMADREKKVPNTLDTRFRIGSMNKMFTAVAILQLAQAGKIKLTDPLVRYLPDYPNKELASKVTIQHLLTHTGGTGDFFGPQFEAHRLELRTHDDYVKLYGTRAVEFEPGSKWEYSNYGFILLGEVIEHVTGGSYYDYVRKHIFEPAGMASTDSLPEDQNVALRSVGYTKEGNDAKSADWRPNTDTLPYRGIAAGGGYSTVGDLVRFASALQAHKLLNAEYTDLLTTGKVDTPSGMYAYGFTDRTFNGVRCFGHGGGAPGMNGELEICPSSGYVVAALANLDPPAAEQIASLMTRTLPDK